MPSKDSDVDRAVREVAALVGLTLGPHHLPGVAENYARLAAQAELLMAFPLEEGDEPAPVYVP